MNSTPYKITILNALILIALSAWGYFSSDNPSMTALIPAIFGVILLALSPGVKKHNKVVAHIVVVLTLIIVIALFMPLKGALDRGYLSIFRIVAMMLSSAIALIVYIKSFIDARKNKA